MHEFLEGFRFGVRATVVGYFAPAVTLWKAGLAAVRHLSRLKP